MALAEVVGGAGLTHPSDFRRFHFHKRIGEGKVKSFMDLYPPLKKGELLEGTEDTGSSGPWEMGKGGYFCGGNVAG